jgi:soluble lytic murein transglycosylase
MPAMTAATLAYMKRRLTALAGLALAVAVGAAPAPKARAQAAGAGVAVGGDEIVLQAREAFRTRDKARLAGLRTAANAAGHPLAMWVDYWELNNRLAEAQQGDLDAFWARWGGTYVEDRLRNDWLLELGRRRDWANFRAEHPRFRMADDREVACYALLTQHLDGLDVRAAARAAWYAQRDGDDGCQLLGQTLFDAKLLSSEDVWQEVRLSVDANRPRAARAAAALIAPGLAAEIDAVFKEPARVLRERRDAPTGRAGYPQIVVFALWRLAAAEPDAAVAQLEQHYAQRLAPPDLAHAWAGVARHAALRLHAQGAEYARRAWRAWDTAARPQGPPWSDEMLAWHVRAALRLPASDRQRWSLVTRAIDAMSAAEQRDPAWVYWKARAALAMARPGEEGDGARALARLQLESIAAPLTFYGQLAIEDLGRKPAMPAVPVPPTESEREATRTNPGFVRALQLIALGLRSEGVREWNYTLRGLDDRDLIAAAALACQSEVWDRCINTSDRSKAEIDIAQRYPTPFREQVLAKAAEVGVDPAYVYGLIRQESRFIMDARSTVGASGLMQLMPATARWTAKKIGIDWKPELITDRDVNLALGMTYLKLLKEDFAGSNVMAAAAYNAGPGRPRRWREGAVVEPAAWVEGIPFNETRDYVKKVLSNTLVYSAVLGERAALPLAGLKARLGAPIGPRDPNAAPADRDLP